MAIQRGLFDPTIDAQFIEFHRTNPHVYLTLVRFAREARCAGQARIGIKALWERMRWELFVTKRDDDFKLNNNFTSRYARLIAQNESDLASLFEIRRLRAA
jgi:hypothetical protein